MMFYNEISEEIERRVNAELDCMYRPGADTVAAVWRKHIVDVLAEKLGKSRVRLGHAGHMAISWPGADE